MGSFNELRESSRRRKTARRCVEDANKRRRLYQMVGDYCQRYGQYDIDSFGPIQFPISPIKRQMSR
jgi:hypothetical protein